MLLIAFSTLARPPQSGCPDGQGFNAFANGDFGSGTDNILSVDPMSAPGYNYSTNPPPDDGFYTITNNTTSWGSFASNWIDIGDNSPDPNGYMMVVNASFSPGIFFRQSVDVCEGTTYQFSADIINLLEPAGPQEILPNVDFLVNGAVLYSTGNIPQNGLWQNVGFTYTALPGQTDVTLELRNNAPGGQGNDLALDNIAFITCGPLAELSIDATPCAGLPFDLSVNLVGGDYVNPYFQWQISENGINWTDIPGANTSVLEQTLMESSYFRVFVADGNVNIDQINCRVGSNSILISIRNTVANETVTLCTGDEIVIDDSTIVNPGLYIFTLTATNGCDSFLTLTVEGGSPTTISIDDTICIGALYLGESYTTSTVIIDTLVGMNGCDSIHITNLFVDNTDLILPADVTIEQGDTYTIIPSASGQVIQWNWTPDTFLSCNDCQIVEVNPITSTRYLLSTLSPANCTDSASILIAVELNKNVFIPNAFSPNNDGINELFQIYAEDGVFEISIFAIYDRWGGKVFEFNNVRAQSNDNPGWNGTVNGQRANEGVYAYFIEVLLLDGTREQYEGDVVLIR